MIFNKIDFSILYSCIKDNFEAFFTPYKSFNFSIKFIEYIF